MSDQYKAESTLSGRFEVESEVPGRQADIYATTYGTNGGGILHGRYARGTKAAPLPILAGDIFAGVGGRALYNAWHDGYRWQQSSPTSIHWVASEDHTSAGFGSYLRILTTPKGTTWRQERVIVADNGTLWVHDETPSFDARRDDHTRPNVTLRVNISASQAAGAAYGATTYGWSDPGYRGLAANGDPASPQATEAGRHLVFLGGHGHTGAGFCPGSNGLFAIKSTGRFTPSSTPTEAVIETTAVGSTARKVRVSVDDAGVYWHTPAGRKINLVELLSRLFPQELQ